MPTPEHTSNQGPSPQELSAQPTLLDFTLQVAGTIDPMATAKPGVTLVEQWLSGLDNDTPLDTVVELLGVEDTDERAKRVTQVLDFATNHDIGFGRGETLGDLHESGAPRLYQQLARPLLRPTRTPDGLTFPYSHFGNTEARTELLREIKRGLPLQPDVVVNMGSGYDITPSDAFPQARVVHVDSAPDIVDFLRRGGFEAYRPDQVPKDLTADLIMSILCPVGADRDIPLAADGTLLTTSNYVPEDMRITGLVPSTRFHILPLVTDPATIAAVRKSGPDVHLLALSPIE